MLGFEALLALSLLGPAEPRGPYMTDAEKDRIIEAVTYLIEEKLNEQ